MNILITGSKCFVGRNLVAQLKRLDELTPCYSWLKKDVEKYE